MQRLVDIAPAQIPQIWALLSQIPDPEVPILTITDLGMVRSVKAQGSSSTRSAPQLTARAARCHLLRIAGSPRCMKLPLIATMTGCCVSFFACRI